MRDTVFELYFTDSQLTSNNFDENPNDGNASTNSAEMSKKSSYQELAETGMSKPFMFINETLFIVNRLTALFKKRFALGL